jgi:hypothetical protein
MVQVFRELRRVLRLDGTVWLNIGDSWNGGKMGRSDHGTSDPTVKLAGNSRGATNVGYARNRELIPGLPPGNLVGIPWRLALALQADGWILRQDIIWAKPSPMPESVRNRCTKAHEYIFLLTQSEDYFYDAEAIKEDSTPSSGGWQSRTKQGLLKPHGDSETSQTNADGLGGMAVQSGNRNKRSVWSMDDELTLFQWLSANDPDLLARFLEESRSKSDVWNVPSYAYPGSHFATFPPRLIEPCIVAGTSEKGCCSECGKPWRRVVESERRPTRPGVSGKVVRKHQSGEYRSGEQLNSSTLGSVIGNRDMYRHTTSTETVGWEPQCGCDTEPQPCIVLDPFMGSGTTAVVSIRHGRWCWGIELSESYLRENAVPRIEGALFDLGMGVLVPRAKAKRSSLFGE